MSYSKGLKNNSHAPDDRNLGDEWSDWDGGDNGVIKVGKGLFIGFLLAVIIISDALLIFLGYMISPRLASFFEELPAAAWALIGLYILITTFWFIELLLTTYHDKSIFFFRARPHLHFEVLFTKVIKLAGIFGVSRDRVGHSFVKVSNAVSMATKKRRHTEEKLLILLPRCLTKEELKKIMEFKNTYPVEICTVSGGELARKKVRELKPTAIIGVACERDLVSGIRDIGGKVSVIGIPNKRPYGPCKDTNVDLEELEDAIKFYVGPPKEAA